MKHSILKTMQIAIWLIVFSVTFIPVAEAQRVRVMNSLSAEEKALQKKTDKWVKKVKKYYTQQKQIFLNLITKITDEKTRDEVLAEFAQIENDAMEGKNNWGIVGSGRNKTLVYKYQELAASVPEGTYDQIHIYSRSFNTYVTYDKQLENLHKKLFLKMQYLKKTRFKDNSLLTPELEKWMEKTYEKADSAYYSMLPSKNESEKD